MKINVVITAGGQSSRYGKNKLFERCKSSFVVTESVKSFLSFDEISKIIVGIDESLSCEFSRIFKEAGIDDRRIVFCAGGDTRTQTVKNAIRISEEDADFIMVHDGARPYVKRKTIEEVLAAAKRHGVALPLLKLTDATARVDGDEVEPVDRAFIRRVQTPFCAKREIIAKAYENAQDSFYDDLSAVKKVYKGKIGVADGDEDNVKITYAGDVRDIECGFISGCGYDIHRTASGDGVKLLGVSVPCDFSFVAHSDGDVPVHALMDAILTALGKKDIGHYFPVDDKKYDGADSIDLLKTVLGIANDEGFAVYNATVTIIAEKPKIAPYIDQMRDNMAKILCVPKERVGIAATTNEQVGDIGDGKAVAAYASVLLVENK